MARHKNFTLAVALPCLLVAVVGLLQYQPYQLNKIATGLSTLVPRRFQIPANETNLDLVGFTTSVKNIGVKNVPWTQQNPAVAPPIPIFLLSEGYINAVVNGTSLPSVANATSSFTNGSLKNRHMHHPYLNHGSSVALLSSLDKRQDWRDPGHAEPCSASEPCPDKSCCGGNGKCGFGPDYCGKDCVSNCDALAMCGRYSEGGSQKCGMNLCCSYYGWCGTSELHCGNPDPHGLSPCQDQFGLCHTVPPPTCGGGSANGRTIGYYQASNTRDRLCNRISPSRIDISGLTHLYFAFAKIDPGSFAVVPDRAEDIPLYTAFTALKSSTLQTWIAIGGFDFSDPGPTRTTWSDLVSTQGSRAAFINSVKSFMAQYGFQGVDLDWEYPATPERGGKRADTDNFVSLVKEMKAAFGGQYGLSLTLAPDYWYLRGFDCKAMEPYVDMFGFMAYDLHGFWDADLKTLGAKVRGQTDVREIYNDTLPLWFDDLEPSKINFGLAYYGRGYTLAHASCNQLGCPFIGPSSPGPCSHYSGVLSLAEIKDYIRKKYLKPQLIQEAMMKQITWDDQWIGYDDEETTEMKKKWASGYCFGGTMIWSIDFKTGAGADSLNPGDNAPLTTDGTCGKDHGNTICGDWQEGGCCSASGYCGKGHDHCGDGCQSGLCDDGLQTINGQCGPLHGNAICGSWGGGACCSSSGYCGATDEYCGSSCISGPCNDLINSDGPSGQVYIDPEIWNGAAPTIQCIPPCTYILPPRPLATPTTINFPPITTSIDVIWQTTSVVSQPGGVVSTLPGGAVITLSAGSVMTLPDGSTTTLSGGDQILTLPGGQIITISPGKVTIQPDGSTTTLHPGVVTTAAGGSTTTLSAGSVFTLSDGSTTTISGSSGGSGGSGGSDNSGAQVLTLPGGKTVTLSPGKVTTLSDGSTTSLSPGLVTKNPDGSTATLTPGAVVTNADGSTSTVSGNALLTLPGGSVATVSGGSKSTSTFYVHTTQTTTISIPPMTTSEIDYWNMDISSGNDVSVFYATPSIQPPPFTITDDPNPQSISGVTHPPVHRTITPQPYPLQSPGGALTPAPSRISPNPEPPSTAGPITHHSGKPNKPCKHSCGHPCRIFCGCFPFCPLPPIDGPPPPPGPPPGPPGPPGGGGGGSGGPPGPPPGPPGPPGGGGGGGDGDENNSNSQSSSQSSSSSCTKSIITDFFVSCNSISGSSADCTTTSTSTMSGCDITAFTTTTGASCPLISLDPNDDQGEDGTMEPSSTTPSTIIVFSTTTVDPTPTPPSTVTSTVIVTPSPPSLIPIPTHPPTNFYVGWILESQQVEEAFPGPTRTMWIIYTIEQGKRYDPCLQPEGSDPNIAYKDINWQKGKRPTYPIELGDFGSIIADKADCTYKRLDDDEGHKQDNPGSLTCSGTLAKCVDDTSDTLHCKDKPQIEWHAQVICSFDGGLDDQLPHSCFDDKCVGGPADPRGPHSKI